MRSNKKIHFEVSERKILLKVFDILFVLIALYLVDYFFDYEYFSFSVSNSYWVFVLAAYINIFGSVFEMYNIQVASNRFLIVKSIILTASFTALVYLLTPIYTPLLPSNRLQIIVFFSTILASLFLWRLFYANYLASHRFAKNAILICDNDQLQQLVEALEKADPHYKIIGYVNTDNSNTSQLNSNGIQDIKLDHLKDFVATSSISEIVIASQKTDGITTNLYNKLIDLSI